MATASAKEVHEAYLAYFGRPPDVAGLNYWMKNEVSTMHNGFGGSAEYAQQYSGMSNAQRVDQVYKNLLGRTADDAGKAYWVDGLTKGTLTVTNLVLAVQAGAQGLDKTVLDNKLVYAIKFTAQMDTAAEIIAYNGAAANTAARAALSAVNSTPASLEKALSTLPTDVAFVGTGVAPADGAAAAAAAAAASAAGAANAAALFTLTEAAPLVTLTGSSTDAFVITLGGGAATRAGAAVTPSTGTLQATDLNFTGSGYSGTENITGTAGNNTIIGGAGADTMTTLGGTDSLTGNAGNDTFAVSGVAGATTITDLTTGDILTIAAGTTSVAATGITAFVATAATTNALVGPANTVLTAAAAGATINMALAGGSVGFTIAGGVGADTLTGSALADVITGGATGANRINGGNGVDTITGGSGVDTIVISSALAANADVVGSWTTGADKVEISKAIFGAVTVANGATAGADFASTTTAAMTGGAVGTATDAQVLVFDATTANLYYNADGATAGGLVLIGTFTGATMAATDFNIVA